MTKKEIYHLALITIIFIAACIETDIYLPAFPDMMGYFGVSEEAIQSLLTYNFLGICLSCPFYGPLADSFGRKIPLIAALSMFAIGSIITVFAGTMDLMIIGRILQGIGSGGCFTLGTAIIFDAFAQDRAVVAINHLNTVIPIIMAGAPMLGGFLNSFFGFRSNFLLITIFVLLSLLICTALFKETLLKEKRKEFSIKGIALDFKRAFSCVPFWQTTIFISLMFGLYIAFLSLISVLFTLELGVDKSLFPLFQTAILGAWVCASLSYKRVVRVLGQRIKNVGLFLTFGGVSSFCFMALAFPTNPYFMTMGMMVQAVGFNFVMTIYFEESMSWLDDIKGTAASILTSGRLLLTAILVGLSGRIYDKSIVPYALLTAVVSSFCLLMALNYERHYGKEFKRRVQSSF